MKLTYSISSSLRGLLAHKSRSALTILGIIIGIASIILISSIGKGAENLIVGQIQSLGSNVIVVVPGKEPTGPTDPAVAESILSDSLKQRDLEALERTSNAPKISNIIPLVFGIESTSYRGETFRPMILGASAAIAEFFNLVPAEGAFFAEEDVRSRRSIVIIGSEVREELFGPSDAIGERIKIKGRSFEIVGILPPKGQILFINFDEAIITPYTTAQQYVFGIRHFNRLIVQTETEGDVPQTVRDIETTLRALHGITDPENDDFFVATQTELAETLATVTGTITLFLAAVAAIALIVGGIGIMNIMLASTTERTKEIGLRKALGATEGNILLQFLLESVTLTVIGGVAGILIGTVLSLVAAVVLTVVMDIAWSFIFPIAAALSGLAVAAFVGLVFGVYPARKASIKDPVEALGYE